MKTLRFRYSLGREMSRWFNVSRDSSGNLTTSQYRADIMTPTELETAKDEIASMDFPCLEFEY